MSRGDQRQWALSVHIGTLKDQDCALTYSRTKQRSSCLDDSCLRGYSMWPVLNLTKRYGPSRTLEVSGRKSQA